MKYIYFDLARLVLSVSALFYILTATGCAPAVGSVESARIIPGPAGYTCFVILKSNGEALGGNCVKD